MRLKKARRKLVHSDFRHSHHRAESHLILVEGDGYIDVDKINERFPNRRDRDEYIRNLIEAFDERRQ